MSPARRAGVLSLTGPFGSSTSIGPTSNTYRWGGRRKRGRVAKAIILTVDDDPAVSQAITRDLRSRYGDTYRILRATS